MSLATWPSSPAHPNKQDRHTIDDTSTPLELFVFDTAETTTIRSAKRAVRIVRGQTLLASFSVEDSAVYVSLARHRSTCHSGYHPHNEKHEDDWVHPSEMDSTALPAPQKWIPLNHKSKATETARCADAATYLVPTADDSRSSDSTDLQR